jgi:hypothetical protein
MYASPVDIPPISAYDPTLGQLARQDIQYHLGCSADITYAVAGKP